MAYNQAAWFAGGVVIPDFNQTMLYAFFSERLGKTQLKVPGGCQKSENGRNDRTPEETLIAELEDDHELLDAGSLTNIKPFFRQPKSPTHFQDFFVAQLGDGARVRERVKVEDETPLEILSVPFLIDVAEFYGHHQTAFAHRGMIPKLVKFMAKENEVWGWKAHRMRLV